MDEKKIKCPKCNTEYDEKFLIGKQGNADVCPLCGVNLHSAEEHPDWITWYYYGVKDEKGNKIDLFLLEDKPRDLEKSVTGTTCYLIKEFKAPPKDKDGNCDAAKRELKKHVADNAFVEKPSSSSEVRCPRCGSAQIQMVPKKFSLLTGFFTNSYNRVCVRCQKKF